MIHEYNAKAYCSEAIDLIENYDEAINDKSSTWDLHHRLELTPDGDVAYSAKDLIRMNLYYNRPASELIFLRKSEHTALHKKGKKLSAEHCAKISAAKKNMSAETRQKISDSQKGQIPWNKGKTVSAETRAKISATLKRRKARKLAEEKRKET